MITGDYEWTAEEWLAELPFLAFPKPEVKHQPGHDSCAHGTCGGVFLCGRCGKYVGWCCGATDGTEADEWCDDCWYEVHGKKD